MAVGDAHITLGNLAAGASVQVQTLTRAKVVGGTNEGTGKTRFSISSDNTNYYEVGAFGWLITGVNTGTSIGNNTILLPANYYLELNNADTVSHNYIIEFIEY